MPELLIETRDLTKRYNRSRTAVDRLNLHVRKGEIYGFLGPNGAGKTTTLRMLVGLIRPSSGSAQVAGHRPGSRESLRQVGALIETPAFYPYLSGRANLAYIAGLSGDRSRIDEVLDRVGLASRGGDRFGSYSQGMKQRLGVAGALLKDPPLLILDEPSNGLDPQGLVEMRDLLHRLRQEGHTVVFSSHLLGEVEQVCDRIGVIAEGRIRAEGTIAELRGGTAEVRVRCTPPDRAREVVTQAFGPDALGTGEDGTLQVAIDADRSWELNQRLVESGVRVHELRTVDRSLEDIFLQLTGGEESKP